MNHRTMNICIFGNQDNAGYRFCKWLREAGHEAHLYMMEHFESERSQPEAIDRSLAESGYPEWLHRFHNTPVTTVFGDRRTFSEIEQRFDVALVLGSIGMMNAHHLRNIPLVNVSTGPSNQGVIRMWDHISLKHRVFWTTVRYFVRKSVRRCTKVLVHYDPEIYSLGVQGALGKIVFYGMPEDVAGNARRVDQAMLQELNARYAQYDRVFIWLGRIAFSDPANPMYKGTNKFLAAAEKVIKEGARVRLVIGKHGEDYQALADMAESAGMSGHIDWVDHMPYWQLLAYLSIANSVIFDELTPLHCVSTGMFRETLSVGGVLVRSFSPVLTRAGHGGDDCPVLHAESAEEVHARMRQVVAWSEDEYRAWRERAMRWALEQLDSRSQIKRLVRLLEEVVYAHGTAARLRQLYE